MHDQTTSAPVEASATLSPEAIRNNAEVLAKALGSSPDQTGDVVLRLPPGATVTITLPAATEAQKLTLEVQGREDLERLKRSLLLEEIAIQSGLQALKAGQPSARRPITV